MDERVIGFIQNIAAQLEGLPETEIRKAVGFYEEYFNEAIEAGQDPEQLIKSLGSPEKIAAMLRTETSLIRAESNPSLRNFSKVLRNSFRFVTTPFTVFLLSTLVLIVGGTVAALFGGVGATILGAIAIVIALVQEWVRIPGHFPMEVMGTFGVALFGSGVFLLLGLYLYKAARLLIRLSTRLIRLISRTWAVKLSGRSLPEPVQSKNPPRTKSPALAYTLLGLTLVGGILAGVSGLPWKYFVIFNSMRSEAKIHKVVTQYDPQGIEKLAITTAHSKIKITRNSASKITITYEQPDWLDYELKSYGSMLSFYEKSNGRLPLFQLVALHESFTELSISLPQEFNPDLITLESIGGAIGISDLLGNITAQTSTGAISFESAGTSGNYNLKADTQNGRILVNGASAGQKAGEGFEYSRKTRIIKNSGRSTINLKSTDGDIHIE